MKRLMVTASFLVVALAGVPAGAATKEVQITNSSFDPKAVRVAVGSSVHWTKGTTRDPHNVRENGGIFTSGSQTTEEIDFTATFSAGKFNYHCVVHQSFGMRGIVKVPVTIQAKPAGRPFTVRWATAATDTGTTYDIQFKVGTGEWTDWLAQTDSQSAVFGQGGKPIRVRADKTYSFRARSRLVDIKSGWSPKRSFST